MDIDDFEMAPLAIITERYLDFILKSSISDPIYVLPNTSSGIYLVGSFP